MLFAAVLVRSHEVNLAQLLAIVVFVLAVAGTWVIARRLSIRGVPMLTRLLTVQFLLLTACFVFSVLAHPSKDPHGISAGIAVMLAVSAMASQFAFLRLTRPEAPSTAVMTGNLTYAVLSLMDATFESGPRARDAAERLTRSLRLLIGFLTGCVLAGVAVHNWADCAWAFPCVLAAVAVVLGRASPASHAQNGEPSSADGESPDSPNAA